MMGIKHHTTIESYLNSGNFTKIAVNSLSWEVVKVEELGSPTHPRSRPAGISHREEFLGLFDWVVG
jgi:hypothetical protein